MRKAEKDHIAAVGEKVFESAYGRAMFRIRQDARLTGLDKIREAIAEEAALQLTGYPPRGLVLPKSCGQPQEDIQRIAEDVLASAVTAA